MPSVYSEIFLSAESQATVSDTGVGLCVYYGFPIRAFLESAIRDDWPQLITTLTPEKLWGRKWILTMPQGK